MPEEFVELEGELAAGVGPDPAARHSGRAWWLRVAAPQVVQTYRAVPSSGQARKSQVSAGGQRGGAGSSQRIPSGEDEVDVFAQGRGGVGAIAGSGEVGTELVALALGWLRGGITGLTGEGDEAGGLRGGGDLVAEGAGGRGQRPAWHAWAGGVLVAGQGRRCGNPCEPRPGGAGCGAAPGQASSGQS